MLKFRQKLNKNTFKIHAKRKAYSRPYSALNLNEIYV